MARDRAHGLGLGLFLYKALALGFPVLAGEKSDLWDIEARVKFSARGRAVKVSLFIPPSTRRLAVVDENFISRGFGLTTTIVDANRQAVWAVRRASGPQGLYYRAVVQALGPGDQEPSAPRPKIDTTRPLQGSHLAAAESLLGEVREQSADLDTLVTQLVKRLADPKPDSNVALLVGHHPDPVKVCEAAVRVLALAQTRTSGAGYASCCTAEKRASFRGCRPILRRVGEVGGYTRPEHQGPVGRVAATSSAFQLHPIQGAQDEIRNHRIRSRDVHESIVLGTVG